MIQHIFNYVVRFPEFISQFASQSYHYLHVREAEKFILAGLALHESAKASRIADNILKDLEASFSEVTQTCSDIAAETMRTYYEAARRLGLDRQPNIPI